MSTSRLQDLERRAATSPDDVGAMTAAARERRRQGLELLPDFVRPDFWEPLRRARRGLSPLGLLFPMLEAIDDALDAAAFSAAFARYGALVGEHWNAQLMKQLLFKPEGDDFEQLLERRAAESRAEARAYGRIARAARAREKAHANVRRPPPRRVS